MKNTICLLLALLAQTHLLAQVDVTPDTLSEHRDTVPAVPDELLEMGYLLAAIGNYGDAHAYFAYSARRAPSARVHNNAGIAAVMDGLAYFTPSDPRVRFRYPIQLDAVESATRDTKSKDQIRETRLREALGHFDAAIQLDTAYAPAYLNKGCAYSLLGDFKRARAVADTAAAMPGYEKTTVDVQVLFGILHALQGDSVRADDIFQAAAEQGSALAVSELNVLRGIQTATVSSGLRLGRTEQVDGIALNDPSLVPEPDSSTAIAVNDPIRFYQNRHPGPHSRYYHSANAATGMEYYFLLTNPDYPGETGRKLRIGADRAAIETAYKKPLRTIETLTGEILVYPTIILVLGGDGTLTQWALYGDNR